MKNFIFYILLLTYTVTISQNTYTGNIVFSNQSQVDSFAEQNYDKIDGTMTFPFNSTVVSLINLESLTEVTEDIIFNVVPQIVSLNGLQNISSIGGDLIIRSNILLENLDGLEGVIQIGGSLDIDNNEHLGSILGLKNLKLIDGFIRISNNDNLPSIEGLNSLISIGIADAGVAAGPPNDAIDNASIIVTNNNILSSCCFLNRIIPLANGVINISNNLNGCNSESEIENFINDCSINIKYPKADDVYVLGRKIKIAFEVVPIVPNASVTCEYSVDDGTSWFDTGIDEDISTNINNKFTGVDWISNLSISEPTNIQLKLKTTINGIDIIEYSEIFKIQPVDYYENQGYRQGISEIKFPLIGWFGSETLGWFNTLGSTGHICMDYYSQDWNYPSLIPIVECGKNIIAPFDGKVIFMTEDYQGNLCGFNPETGTGIRLVIQSEIDKSFAMATIHMKSIRPELILGSIVSKGDIIGKVGGSGLGENDGIRDVHLHFSLYKNIYEWFPMVNSNNTDEYTSYSIIEYLKLGFSFLTFNPDLDEECEFTKNNFSANFIFDSDNINTFIRVEDALINSGNDFNNFLTDQYISIAKNLIIDYLSTDKSNQNNPPIVTLDGLETLTSIDGSLRISNTDIMNLDGLKNLIFVGGDVVIENNNQLTNFCGLYRLIENNGIGGDMIINGNVINPTQSEILNNFGCESILLINNEQINKTLVLYPNPVTNILRINSNSINKIEIYSINGILLKTALFKNSLNINNLSNGVYFVNIYINNKKTRFKIIKK